MLTKELVVVDLAIRKFRFAERNRGVVNRESEFAAVHIGAIFDGPVDLQGIARVIDHIAKDILRRCSQDGARFVRAACAKELGP